MNEEFEIPAGICPEAKHFIKYFLAYLQDQQIEMPGIYHGCLEILVHIYHDLVKAKEIIKKEGSTITEKNDEDIDITKIHPAVQIQRDCEFQFNQWIEELEFIPGQLQIFKQ